MRACWAFTLLFLLTAACRRDVTSKETREAKCDAVGADHDTLYRRGVELIEPHMIVTDRRPPVRKDADIRVGIACLDRVLELDPSNWATLWIRGKAFQALGEHSSAVESFGAAYRLQANNPDVGREYMMELLETRSFANAVKVAREAAERDPADAGLKANLALALVLDGEITRAQQIVADALKQNPNDPITQALQKRIDEIASGARPQPKTVQELER